MKKTPVFLAILTILAVSSSFWLGSATARKKYEKALKHSDTVTITKWEKDTVYLPKDTFIVKWKTAYFPVHDTTYLRDTLNTTDSVLVDVPITEKHYAGENYRATIRGYQAELADIWIRQKETTITVPYRKRWSVTVGPQVGCGITPKGWQPYAGAGLTFGYSF